MSREQQDEVPGHTADMVQIWLAINIADFWLKRYWLQDLKLLDYFLWCKAEKKVCAVPHNIINVLKASVER